MARKKGHSGQIEAQVAERRLQALQLRQSGASYRQIGAALDISHVQALYDVRNSLAELAKKREAEAQHFRELELSRLDAMQLAVWPRALKGELGAVTVVLKVLEQRARMLGLNEATKHELSILIDVAPTVLRLVEVLTEAGLKPSDVFERMIQRVQADRETVDAAHGNA